MELGILERIHLFNLLQRYAPRTGNAITMRSLKRLFELLPFEDDETNAYEIKFDGEKGRYTWEETGYKRDFPVSDSEMGLIKTVLTEADREGVISMDFIPFFDLIMAEKMKECAIPENVVPFIQMGGDGKVD